MKKSYIERAEHFAEIISRYIEAEMEANKALSMARVINGAAMKYNINHSRHNLVVRSGTTRIVLIISDYVLKIDIHSSATFGDSETELKGYEFAVSEGIEKYFAKITKYTSKNDINFYIMPRIKQVGCMDKEWFYDTIYDTDPEAWHVIRDNFEDFHENNFGVKNGYPVAIDYACNCFTENFYYMGW